MGVTIPAAVDWLQTTYGAVGTDLFQGNAFAPPGEAFPQVPKTAYDFAANRLLPF